MVDSSHRDVAQPGSAFAWGASGRWFESSHPDQIHNIVCVYLLCYFFIYENLIIFFNELMMILLPLARMQNTIVWKILSA